MTNNRGYTITALILCLSYIHLTYNQASFHECQQHKQNNKKKNQQNNFKNLGVTFWKQFSTQQNIKKI